MVIFSILQSGDIPYSTEWWYNYSIEWWYSLFYRLVIFPILQSGDISYSTKWSYSFSYRVVKWWYFLFYRLVIFPVLQSGDISYSTECCYSLYYRVVIFWTCAKLLRFSCIRQHLAGFRQQLQRYLSTLDCFNAFNTSSLHTKRCFAIHEHYTEILVKSISRYTATWNSLTSTQATKKSQRKNQQSTLRSISETKM